MKKQKPEFRPESKNKEKNEVILELRQEFQKITDVAMYSWFAEKLVL